MGRFKKGCRRRKDRWEMAGGRESIVNAVKSGIATNGDTSYSSSLWVDVSINLFGNANKANCHWVWVTWSKNRRGFKDLTCRGARESTEGEDHSNESEDDSQSAEGKNMALEDEDIDQGNGDSVEEEDKDKKGDAESAGEEAIQQGDIWSAVEEDSEKQGSKGSAGEGQRYGKRKRTRRRHGGSKWRWGGRWECHKRRIAGDKDTEKGNAGSDGNEDIEQGDGGSAGDEDMEKGDGGSAGDEDMEKGDGGSAGEEDMEKGDGGSAGEEDMEKGDGGSAGEENMEKGDGGSAGEEDVEEGDGGSAGEEDMEKGDGGSAGEEDVEEEGDRGSAGERVQKQKFRQCPAIPKRFVITLPQKTWKRISPDETSNQLKPGWSNILYKYFKQKNPCCPLSFQNHHIRLAESRKRNSPYLNILAKCIFPACSAKYNFKVKEKPDGAKKVKMKVSQTGQITHFKKTHKSRPATKKKRGRIARALHKGVSNVFHKKIRRAPADELTCGNLSSILSKNVLKVISAEFRRNRRVHDNVLNEMHLTQAIIKECDNNYTHLPGYVQNFQLEPFSVHLYTEASLQITAQHLKKKAPLTLYLDATGNVASKIPGQKARVLYYALTLPGGGVSSPPLPVCEMLTNEHSIPPITFWLMQFNRHLTSLTKKKVAQIETDYSWALIQSVLLAFNKESAVSYLERAMAICSEALPWNRIKQYTILHLCSAHILKAVSLSIGRKTSDKGLKVFATFVFARLLNCSSLKTALIFFKSMCIVFTSKLNGNILQIHLNKMENAIKAKQNTKLPDDTKKDIREDEVVEMDSSKVIKGSPFHFQFQRVYEDAKEEIENDHGHQEHTPNPYYCPAIIDLLFDNYLGIFPLWSGVLLGDLRQYASDKKEGQEGKDNTTRKTRDTNCHVEKWFGIVKNSILRKKLRLRPAIFVRKMNSSLRGRYKEHILNHSLSESLWRTLKTKDIGQSQESWAKRQEQLLKTKRSKYFSTPQKVPAPKAAKKTPVSKKAKKIPAPKTAQKMAACVTEKKEVPKQLKLETLWAMEPTERVVAVIKNTRQKMRFVLRHREILTLKPHELIVGEAMECYVRATLNTMDPACRLYQLNHQSMGMILFGTHSQMARQGLRTVSFDDYDGAVGFVNTGNHWKFVYLHALTQTIYVVDPLHAETEVEDSKMAARRFGQYFKMRRNCLGKEDWVCIKWKAGTIPHTFQKDESSCGVFVMQMAKLAVMGFPQIPQFNIDPSKKSIAKLRKEMTKEILQGSVASNDFCALCGLRDVNRKACWIQCETCLGWFHLDCIGMQRDKIPAKETTWYCQWCQPSIS